MEKKICNKCKEEKDLDENNFPRRGRGFYWRCKPCHAEDQAISKAKKKTDRPYVMNYCKTSDPDFLYW